MCGLAGFIARNHGRPDLATLSICAQSAARRGPHAYGFAWHSPNGFEWCRYPERFTRFRAEEHRSLLQASALVGHFRLATTGDYRDPNNNQPLLGDQFALAHNGELRGADTMARRHKLQRESSNDSEVLLRLFDQEDDYAAFALLAREPYALLLLSRLRPRLFAWAHDLPLYRLDRDEGSYFSSWPVSGSYPVTEAMLSAYEEPAYVSA